MFTPNNFIPNLNDPFKSHVLVTLVGSRKRRGRNSKIAPHDNISLFAADQTRLFHIHSKGTHSVRRIMTEGRAGGSRGWLGRWNLAMANQALCQTRGRNRGARNQEGFSAPTAAAWSGAASVMTPETSSILTFLSHPSQPTLPQRVRCRPFIWMKSRIPVEGKP